MALADAGAAMEAAGVTSAITVDNARSFAHRGKGRGHRVPTVEGKPCKRGHTLRYGPGASHEGACAKCHNLSSLAIRAESNRIRNAAMKVVGSEAWWSMRESAWKTQGIRLVDGSFLDRETYLAVLRFERGRCPVCDADMLCSGKPGFAEHDHRSGLLRGVVCGVACNVHAIATVESGRRLSFHGLRGGMVRAKAREVVEAYLIDPPYQRWLHRRSALSRGINRRLWLETAVNNTELRRCESCGSPLPAYPEGNRPRGRPPKVCRACAQDGSPLRKARFDRRRGRGVDMGPDRGDAVKPETDDFNGLFVEAALTPGLLLSIEASRQSSPPPKASPRKTRKGLSSYEARLLRNIRRGVHP